MPLCRNRAQQLRRMGAHDSHITLALSTAFGRNLDDLDREEVLDPIEVALGHQSELGAGGGAGPEEGEFHGCRLSVVGCRLWVVSGQWSVARTRQPITDNQEPTTSLLNPIPLPLLQQRLA